jgi:hypothetical protein
MEKSPIVSLLAIVFVCMVHFSCLKNSPETTPLDTTVVGKWAGYIIPINFASVQFNGAKIFMDISAKDSTFNLVARDTSDTSAIVSQEIKDTILVLAGAWRLNTSQDSIVLSPSSCRALDTLNHTLSSRDAQGHPIPIPKYIEKRNNLIIWEISFADLASLVPLLGLSISEELKGLLKTFPIILEKLS